MSSPYLFSVERTRYQLLSMCFRSRPKNEKKAKCHWISRDEISPTHRVRAYRDVIKDSFFLMVANQILHQKDMYSDLRRGDLIFVEPYLGVGNDGRMIWDGSSAEPLDYAFIPTGAIPSTYQVGKEFPTLYWSEFLDRQRYVPFSCTQHLPDLKESEVTSGEYSSQLRISFVGCNNEVYALYTHPRVSMSKRQFLDCLIDSDYFLLYSHPDFYFTYPSNLAADRILIVDEEDARDIVYPRHTPYKQPTPSTGSQTNTLSNTWTSIKNWGKTKEDPSIVKHYTLDDDPEDQPTPDHRTMYDSDPDPTIWD